MKFILSTIVLSIQFILLYIQITKKKLIMCVPIALLSLLNFMIMEG